MTAFANSDDLAARLNRVFTVEEAAWIDGLLVDASDYLRGVIGCVVFPATQSTYTAYPTGGRVDLPQAPVVSVDAVKRDGADVGFTYRPGYVLVDCDDPVVVTFTWGFAEPPAELVRLSCVLVSQTLITLENQLGLTAGGLSSVALDDFRLAWADGGEQSGMALTRHAEDGVRRQFGQGDVTVVETGR